ncbi:uncharacterized protein K441DRAFT_578186, partial [Cenococcum geophilum 1.58]|uniref:uncharacterized protein n=1 Tax=Cenococcum geophilum 1.58 TaxID=794803 RepID=UPI00358EF09C
ISFFNPQGILELVLHSYLTNVIERSKDEDKDNNNNSEFNNDLDTLRAYLLVIAALESDACEIH